MNRFVFYAFKFLSALLQLYAWQFLARSRHEASFLHGILLQPRGGRTEDVRQSIRRIRANPFIPHKDSVRGFIYEVETGRLREVN